MIRNHSHFWSKTARCFAALCLSFAACSVAYAEPGCRTGAQALADVFVRANPIYAYYFGSLESYVVNNQAHFQSGGDSVRCAEALSQAFLGQAIGMYDPNDLRRRGELNARMGAMGVSPGPQQPTLSQQLLGLSMQLSRLARVLPSAAAGNYQPLYTPTNEFEQMPLFAAQMLQMMVQDPSMASVMAQIEPIARESANLEKTIIRRAAAALADTRYHDD
jgi:hypothetical protein